MKKKEVTMENEKELDMNLLMRIFWITLTGWVLCCVLIFCIFMYYHEAAHVRIGLTYGADDCSVSYDIAGGHTACVYNMTKVTKQQFSDSNMLNLQNEITGYHMACIIMAIMTAGLLIVIAMFCLKFYDIALK